MEQGPIKKSDTPNKDRLLLLSYQLIGLLEVEKTGLSSWRTAYQRTMTDIVGFWGGSPPQKAEWLVWSNEHNAYWRKNNCGYTDYASGAGLYTQEEAIKICSNARSHGEDGTPPPETMIHIDSIIRHLSEKNEKSE